MAASASFVSRGGVKLEGALSDLSIDVSGLVAIDAGASTGGFTDCLLQRGAKHVFAIDVAYGQLAWTLRNDPRVTVLERTNIRYLDQTAIADPADLIVADLSFISLRTVRDALLRVASDHSSLLLMVKPQFELPTSRVPRGGVVREPAAWLDAVTAVVDFYRLENCALQGATPSMITGPKGNREFFVHLRRRGSDTGNAVLNEAVGRAP